MLTGPQIYSMVPALAARLQNVRAGVQRAAATAGRSVESVTIVAVSKGHPPAAIAAAAQLGQQHFGENYLQEALPKIVALQNASLTWHYIGRLQANKTRPVAEHFDWVHTVERHQIAQRLSAHRPARLPPLNVCLQVNIGADPRKAGTEPGAALALAQMVAALPRLRLRGLMCMLPERLSVEQQGHHFRTMHELLLQLQSQLPAVDTLSMGMSGDYTSAIVAGATLVRIGTAIFGKRA
jgi:pyridoxal phosphate enzyme (YggS family)